MERAESAVERADHRRHHRRPHARRTRSSPRRAPSATALEYDDFFDVADARRHLHQGPEPRAARRQPARSHLRDRRGMLNAIGLANVGVEAFCTREAPDAPRAAASPSSPTSSPPPSKTSSPSRGALDAETGVAAIELNVSCPNVDKGGLEFGCDARPRPRSPRRCAR